MRIGNVIFGSKDVKKLESVYELTSQVGQMQQYIEQFRNSNWMIPPVQPLDNQMLQKNTSGICINLMARDLANIREYAVRIVPGIETNEPLPSMHWLNDLLENPNRALKLPYYEIKRLSIVNLLLTGNAFIYTPLNGRKQPVQMWVLPADWRVRAVPGVNTYIEYYKITTQNSVIEIPSYELCHIKTLKNAKLWERNFFMGSPIDIETAMDYIGSEAGVAAFLDKMFRTDSVAQLYLKTNSELTDYAEVIKTKSMITDLNITRQMKVIAPPGAEILPIPTTNWGESAMIEYVKTNQFERMICRNFGIPYGYFNSESQQNVATAQENRNTYFTSNIEPRQRLYESFFNMHWSQYEPLLGINHKQYVPKDTMSDLKTMEFKIMYGIMTRNEARLLDGLEPLEGGDIPLTPTTVTNWTVTNSNPALSEPKQASTPLPANEPKQLSEPVQDDAAKSIESESSKKKAWKKLDNIAQKSKSKIEGNIQTVLTDLRDYILKKAQKDTTKEVNLDIDKWQSILSNSVSPEIKSLILTIVSDMLDEWDSTGSLTDYEKEIQKATRDSTDLIKESINTIKSDLKNSIQKLVDDNIDISKEELNSKIQDLVREKFNGNAKNDGYIKARSELIAQTTATSMTTKGQDIVIKRLNLKKVWLSQRDADVRGSHRMMDGQEAVNNMFNVNGTYCERPADPVLPAKEVCNCRCYLLAKK